MLFAVGTRVRLRNTGDEGTISEIIGDGMFSIYLEDADMEIPAFEGNLVRIESEDRHTAHVIDIEDEVPVMPARPKPLVQYQTLSSKGILLAFDPEYHPDGTTKEYHIHLINDTKEKLIFAFELYLEDDLLVEKSGQLDAHSILSIGELLGDELNEHPEVEIDIWKATTEGRKNQHHKVLKIKPKQFFKNLKTAPFLSKKAHLYTLFEQLEDASTNEPIDSLKDYTKLNATRPRRDTSNPFYRIHDVVEYAEFKTEIDLHINQLVKNPKDLDPRQIGTIQMRHFENYLTKAIRLGVPSVFVIHGVGEGKLRNKIARRLEQYPQVKSFKNEYHHRYGFGATEIIF